ncbi:MAG TPA: hypothetical protein VJ912_04475 [Candidatus Nanoarchaeia archaeon]|nr:hypothetical protein [Candidatus Nanoarchaeia archaeon]
MAKKFLLLIIVFFIIILPTTIAEDIDIEINKISSEDILIKNTTKPAIFNVEIKNTGRDSNFEFYSYAATSMEPQGKVFLERNEKKNITLKFYDLQKKIDKGNLAFSYFIRRKSSGEKEEKQLIVRIVQLKEALDISTERITPADDIIKIKVKNKFDYVFKNIDAQLSSPFFEISKSFSLDPYEEESFTAKLDKKGFDNLLAGFYTLETKIKYINNTAKYQTPISFVEKKIIQTTKQDKGFFIDKEIVRKTNNGNVVAGVSITTQENIFSRLFTTFNVYPDNIEREGGKVFFIWNRELEPGESFEIQTKTNWFYPLIIILLFVGIIYFFKKITIEDVELRKKLRFVKTHGGEFGLKISIMINANKFVEDIVLRDKLPALAKIHEKFGGERPHEIDKKKRKIEWKFDRLEAGERRMVSYVIYSKIGVLGRFALPSAVAFYKKQGKLNKSHSNKAFFVAEQAKK